MKIFNSVGVRRFVLAFCALLGILTVGTFGYHAFGEGWMASFYRSLVAVSLSGFDSAPDTDPERIFTIIMILFGVAIFLYVASAIAEAIAHGFVTGVWQERRRRLTIEAMRNHFIICGYGRVGSRTAHEFRESRVPYVVVDFHEDALERARQNGDIVIEGSGTEDRFLDAAGIERARGLVASADSDVDNLYITLSARAARPDILIVARASDDGAAKKLRLAGADRIVQPYSTAGREMAKLVLRPQVAAFLDVAASTAGVGEMQFEEIVVTPDCPRVGITIGELRDRDVSGAAVVAVRRQSGVFDATPSPDLTLDSGDILIAVGTAPELRALEELFAPAEVGRK